MDRFMLERVGGAFAEATAPFEPLNLNPGKSTTFVRTTE